MCTVAALFILLGQPQSPLPELLVSGDDTVVSSSCSLRIPQGAIIEDKNGNGVIHIKGDQLTVRFVSGSMLRGAPAQTAGNELRGVGISIRGNGIRLEDFAVSGFRVAVHATDSQDLSIARGRLTGNFRQRLRSNTQREDPRDWLRPHHNDQAQWLTHYGAALALQNCTRATVEKVRVRQGQNGIVLMNCNQCRLFDNDASFLSGWGLALWRSSENIICRNAFDFCIRGYSHGHYNRGQDSAGILMFEQCCKNSIIQNSVTHGGDGLFAFAGEAALSKAERLGCNQNLIQGNDFSFAAAHGLELTFSFDNRIIGNRFEQNAICGIWGGYSQRTLIRDNVFVANGDMGYGLERGAINIEHGRQNIIAHNRFEKNRCAVHLWSDQDPQLATKPWVKHNARGSTENIVASNVFNSDTLALHLRSCEKTVAYDNTFNGVEQVLESDAASKPTEKPQSELTTKVPGKSEWPGTARPVGARKAWRGRHNILVSPWGPWDRTTPALNLVWFGAGKHIVELWGLRGDPEIKLEAADSLVTSFEPGPRIMRRYNIGATQQGVFPYTMNVTDAGWKEVHHGVIQNLEWDITVFKSPCDPRQDLAKWRAAAASGLSAKTAALKLAYGMDGPSDLYLSNEITNAEFPKDGFGTVARTTATFPAGTWILKVQSDDGVRLKVNGQPLIENWTHHGPTWNRAELRLEKPKKIELEIEHFELDSASVLEFDLEYTR